MNPAKTYASDLAQNLTKITMTDFFKTIHSRFYADQDISFMEYFLELTEHEGEFIVHHEKLREYGIVTSERSSVIKEKLDQLMLIENEDYVLQDVLQNPQVGGRPSKIYYLTPEAFKKCLMRAQRRANQPVDPVIYCDYYLLLEKIHKLYTDYERLYSEKLLSMKDDKIDEQSRKIDKMSKQLEDQSEEMKKQSEEIKQLLAYGKSTTQTLHKVSNDLTETKETVEIAKSYLEEKSFTSTKNPSDESKHHYFAATTYFHKGNQIVKFLTGQKSYVEKQIAKRVNEDDHKVIVKPFYNANGIDLRQNVYDEFLKRRNDRIKEINHENKLKDKEFNKELRKQISKHNKENPDNKRSYTEEKKKTQLVSKSDISVKFMKLSFTYTINPHIGFNEILQIIIDVNGITQESPLNSDEE